MGNKSKLKFELFWSPPPLDSCGKSRVYCIYACIESKICQWNSGFMLSFSSELLRTPWSHLGDLRCEGFSKVYALHVQVWFLRDASLPFTTYSMRFFVWLKWLLPLRLCVWMIISVRKSSVHFPGWSIPELSRPVPLVLVTSFITLAIGDWKQQVHSHPEKNT